MRTERSGKSYALAWTVAMFAMPVLYLLSIAPLAVLTERMSGLPRTGHYRAPPRWLQIYCAPGDWVYKNTPLRDTQRAYALWCRKLARHLD
jgi:hypothetical protein